MITKERLEYIKEKRSKISGEGNWHLVKGREGQFPRYDVYCGPEIQLKEGEEVRAKIDELLKKIGKPPMRVGPDDFIKKGEHQHITHIHQVQPAWFEQNPNYLADSEFISESPKFVDDLLKEIEFLQEKICICGNK